MVSHLYQGTTSTLLSLLAHLPSSHTSRTAFHCPFNIFISKTKHIDNMSAPLLSQPAKPAIRRLSSISTTFEDLALGPSVVVPPEYMAKPSDAHETAAAMEMAKHRLKERANREGDVTPPTPVDTLVTDQYAFAFDIDGVLIRGGKPIPQAVEAMKVLNGQNEYGVKVPYIFVTNGGGKTEQERCLDLSRQLELEISPGQFICGMVHLYMLSYAL